MEIQANKTHGMLSALASWAIANPSISNALRLGLVMRGFRADQSSKSGDSRNNQGNLYS